MCSHECLVRVVLTVLQTLRAACRHGRFYRQAKIAAGDDRDCPRSGIPLRAAAVQRANEAAAGGTVIRADALTPPAAREIPAPPAKLPTQPGRDCGAHGPLHPSSLACLANSDPYGDQTTVGAARKPPFKV